MAGGNAAGVGNGRAEGRGALSILMISRLMISRQDDDLAQRLRYLAEHMHDDGLLDYAELAARAATRIEEQQTHIDALEKVSSWHNQL